MICGSCGTENREGRRFCRSCGATLSAACPTCGAASEPGDKFCGDCGAALPEAGSIGGAAATSAPVSSAADGRAAGGRAAGGRAAATEASTERRVVSILFADLVGFTAFSDDRDPEMVREFLAAYFEVAREIVERYGGAVEKFIGDAVMAVWGAPVAREDDAERAVRAALDLVSAVPQLEAPDRERPQARAAVLTGEAAVAVGAVGQGMVAGDLVNTASRLQGAAPPGTVLVGEATQRAASGAIAFEPAGEQLLRGKVVPVPAWQAVRVVGGQGGAGRSARLEPPFVGRDNELQLLKDMLHATAREGRARLVSIVGQAGIGKSRLAWELEKYVGGIVLRVYWHRGHSLAYGDGLAYWALGEMVRERARIAETDDPDISRQKLASTIAEFIADPAERDWVQPRLEALLGLADASAGDRETTEAAWRLLFERIAEQGPVVLVFEEAQWADDSLLDFIETMMDRSRQRPILVLTLARPELLDRRPAWGAGMRAFTSLHLDRLTADDMELLLVGLAPGLPQPAVQAIVERADGVPLYAVEMVRMLLDTGALEERDGRFHLDPAFVAPTIPESLAALAGARLDALAEPERVLLGHAAVLGQSVTIDALANAMGLAHAELIRTLGSLVHKEVLRLDDDPRSPERGQYQFVQSLIREVAYERLSLRDRLARHLAAARYFEGLDDAELAGIVTSHYLEAYRLATDDRQREELAATVRTALLRAAERARVLNAHRSELTYLEQALPLAIDPRQEIEILEPAWEAALLAAGTPEEFQHAVALARRGLQTARAADDRSATARATLAVGRGLILSYRGQEAQQELRGMLEELDAGGSDASLLVVRAELARAHMMLGDPEPVLAISDVALAQAEHLGAIEVIAELLVSRAWALALLGRPREATVLLQGVIPLCDRHGFLNSRIRAAMNLSDLGRDDDPAMAMRVALDGMAVARRFRIGSSATGLASNAAEVALPLGDWTWVGDVTTQLEQDGLYFAMTFAALPFVSAAIQAFRGDPTAAAELVTDVFPRLPMSDRQVAFGAHGALAMFAFASGDDAEAWTHQFLAVREINRATWCGSAARIAAWRHNLPDLRTARALLVESPDRGRWVDAEHARVDAAIAALEGREAEAIEGYDTAFRIYKELGLRFELAMGKAELAELLPDAEGSDAAREEARSILTELGAVALLRRLRAPTAAAPASPAATAAEPASPAN